MRHVCLLVLAAAGAASNASAYQVYSDAAAWADAFGPGSSIAVEGFDGAALGYYAPASLGASAGTAFSNYIGGGPSDAARTNYAGASLVGPDGLWTITTSNASKPGNAAMFVLASPSDKNDVDNRPGKPGGAELGEPNPYLSFYNAGTSLTVAFGPSTLFNGFSFESYDLGEGRVEISWFDGQLHNETLFPGDFDSFFGLAGGVDPLEWVRITSVGNQGIAVDNLSFAAMAVPTPGSAALGVLGAGVLAARRRRG